MAWVELATALQLIRLPGTRPWTALWAEDGHYFLVRGLEEPFGSLFETHGGYYQFAARAIGSATGLVPLERAPSVFAYLGALSAALLSLYVFYASDSVFRTRWARGLLAGVMVLTPAAIYEVSANGLDAHWYLLFACFWALWSTASTPRRVVADALVVAVATVSSPLTTAYAPLALRRVWLDRGPGRWVVPGLFAAGAIAQASYILTHPGNTRFADFEAGDLPGIFAVRVAGSAIVGDSLLQGAWETFGWSLAVGAAAFLVAVALWALGLARGQRRLFVLAATAYAVILMVGSAYLRGTVESRMEIGAFSLNGSRYHYVPILLVTAVFVALGDLRGRLRWARRVPALVVAGTLVTNFWPPEGVRTDLPEWRDSVVAAEPRCRDGAETVDIPVAPPPLFFARLPCDDVTDAARRVRASANPSPSDGRARDPASGGG